MADNKTFRSIMGRVPLKDGVEAVFKGLPAMLLHTSMIPCRQISCLPKFPPYREIKEKLRTNFNKTRVKYFLESGVGIKTAVV